MRELPKLLQLGVPDLGTGPDQIDAEQALTLPSDKFAILILREVLLRFGDPECPPDVETIEHVLAATKAHAKPDIRAYLRAAIATLDDDGAHAVAEAVLGVMNARLKLREARGRYVISYR